MGEDELFSWKSETFQCGYYGNKKCHNIDMAIKLHLSLHPLISSLSLSMNIVSKILPIEVILKSHLKTEDIPHHYHTRSQINLTCDEDLIN